MTLPELKPCPFCGGQPSHNDGGNSRYGRFWWRVGCVDCGVFFNDQEKWDANSPGNLDQNNLPQECFATWNTRTDTIPDPMQDPRVVALVDGHRQIIREFSGILHGHRACVISDAALVAFNKLESTAKLT